MWFGYLSDIPDKLFMMLEQLKVRKGLEAYN